MMFFSHLDKEDLSPELFDDRLPAAEMPPFNGVVQLAACHDDPIRKIKAGDLLDERRNALLCMRKVNIAREPREFDLQRKLIVEVIDETVQEMHGSLVRRADQGIMAFKDFDFRIACIQRTEIGVVLPELRAAGANVSEELFRITFVEISNRCGKHHQVARRLIIDENQLLHSRVMANIRR